MTHFRPFAPVVCFALALSGCGGGSSAKHSTTPTPSPTPLTAAQAKVLAAAAVVAAEDLPGYKAEIQKTDPSDAASTAALDRCIGVPVTTYLAEDPGKAYTLGPLEIDSSGSVVTTAAMAKGEVDALISKGQACIKTAILDGQGSDLSKAAVTITPQTLTVPGADEAFVYDIILTGESQGHAVALSGSEAGALVGQTEIQISTFGEAHSGLSVDELTALLTKAVARVKAAA